MLFKILTSVVLILAYPGYNKVRTIESVNINKIRISINEAQSDVIGMIANALQVAQTLHKNCV